MLLVWLESNIQSSYFDFKGQRRETTRLLVWNDIGSGKSHSNTICVGGKLRPKCSNSKIW